jgi:AbrB family looped-hinge helix DNA binding protein
MKINKKGQVTIPKAIRDRAGLHPDCEVNFVVRADGEVVIRRVPVHQSTVRAAFERVRGSATSKQFKGMGTDAYMRFLRG